MFEVWHYFKEIQEKLRENCYSKN